jgi:hypothetical protein
MAKDCGHKVPCGCGDQSLTTPPPCNTAEECAGERCSELFSQECIAYTGEPMQYPFGEGSIFTVNPGDRLDTILQKIIVAALGNEVASSFIPLTRVIAKTATTLTIEFIVQETGDYIFNAEQQSPLTNNVMNFGALAPGTYTHTFINLMSGEDYIVYSENDTEGYSGMEILVTLP